jgi:hypothetical protein
LGEFSKLKWILISGLDSLKKIQINFFAKQKDCLKFAPALAEIIAGKGPDP